jgi:hypothetical protein
MTVLLFLLAAAAPADAGHCDSKPFTLKKPVAAAPKPAATPAPKPAPKPKKTASTKKYVIGCKQAKS